MTYRSRINYTSEQKKEMWDRWQKGDSLKDIGRSFGRPSSSIYGILSPTGGIRPLDRKRSPKALSLVEREEISRGIVSGLSIRTIASKLGRSPSTISREIKRNGGYKYYRAASADEVAWDKSKRPKLCKLACSRTLRLNVAKKLQQQWSPEQVARWLKLEYPKEEHNRVSHETIYKSLYIQTRGVLKKELLQHLRTKRTIRRSKHSTMKKGNLGQIKDAISISCLLYTSPSPRDQRGSRMPSSA